MAETSSNTRIDPRRGEIWILRLDPTVGAEIRKTRPVLVVGSDSLRRLPLRLVAPITEARAHLATDVHVPIRANAANGLSKDSVVDTLQLRGVDLSRFVTRLGKLTEREMQEVAAAIAIVVEYR